MAVAVYLPERQTEYWTSREIEGFLLDAGYDIMTLPLSQRVEHQIPSDFLYLDRNRNKIFGLQYKALYHNSRDHWKLDAAQHTELQKFPWMYYCTSELKSLSEARAALHYSRFYAPGFAFQDKLPMRSTRPAYRRWGNFFQRFEECSIGMKITSKEQFREILSQTEAMTYHQPFIEQMLDFFFVDLDKKTAVHLHSHGIER